MSGFYAHPNETAATAHSMVSTRFLDSRFVSDPQIMLKGY
jgi:hypothetical protein